MEKKVNDKKKWMYDVANNKTKVITVKLKIIIMLKK
jgi:hypothetical protein